VVKLLVTVSEGVMLKEGAGGEVGVVESATGASEKRQGEGRDEEEDEDEEVVWPKPQEKKGGLSRTLSTEEEEDARGEVAVVATPTGAFRWESLLLGAAKEIAGAEKWTLEDDD